MSSRGGRQGEPGGATRSSLSIVIRCPSVGTAHNLLIGDPERSQMPLCSRMVTGSRAVSIDQASDMSLRNLFRNEHNTRPRVSYNEKSVALLRGYSLNTDDSFRGLSDRSGLGASEDEPGALP